MLIRILDDRLRKLGEEYPRYHTTDAAGFDLRVCNIKDISAGYGSTEPVLENFKIERGSSLLLGTGLAIDLTTVRSGLSGLAHYCGLVLIRSSWGKHGLTLSNGVGLIDPDYQGEIILAVTNRSNKDLTIFPMDRIAQLVITPFLQAKGFVEVDSFEPSERGDGSFGSTGDL